MDITSKIQDYIFFDFDKFRDDITEHFRDNAKLIGLTKNQVVGNSKDLSNAGLLVEVYLETDNPLMSEHINQLPSLEQMFFVIDVILLGEGKSDSEKSYKELMSRTQKLAVICEYLYDALRKNKYGCAFVIGNKINTFRAVLDSGKSSDNIHNACKIYGYFSAFRKQSAC